MVGGWIVKGSQRKAPEVPSSFTSESHHMTLTVLVQLKTKERNKQMGCCKIDKVSCIC